MAPPFLFFLLVLALSVRSAPQSSSGLLNSLVGTLPVIDNWKGAKTTTKRAAQSPRVLTLAVEHVPKTQLMRRDVDPNVVNETLTSRSDVSYYVDPPPVKIGQPPQNVKVQLDTGSFELWVDPDCSKLSSNDIKFCQSTGRYEVGRSRTAVVTQGRTTLQYGIGAANITYVEDSIGFPGSPDQMQNVRFGVASSSQQQFAGILGVGFGGGITIPYPSFMDQLAAQQVTASKSLGVALGSKAEGAGSVAFGGVDTSKYAGRLAAVPIIDAKDSPDKVPRYWVKLESVSHSPPGEPSTVLTRGSMDVFLDTGATLTLLPSAVVQAMANAVGSTGSVSGLPAVSCRLANNENGAFGFRFNGVTIFVPYKEIIRQLPGQRGQRSQCCLGVMPSDKFALLGDTFLRSAYAVFDLDSKTIYMARYSNCGSTIEAITRDTRLKGMRGMCQEPTVAQNRLTSSDDEISAAAASLPGRHGLNAIVSAVAVCVLMWVIF
ncbi:putative aspartyl protease [Ophiocordyceps polyrhachis-furcata BCC 54312]|uniref:Aspartyl protease n=1 Tax=Ophiocordyceps polyrhachis-furcata BCC 54312 TaxID=1330021 RepID=A0A367LNP2_9HYPO|nr:putative aspartyl protease [Ophiocordyceps polyrhachis-furcata BCC 54312]